MPLYRDVPCLYCGKTFTWQNDANPEFETFCCQWCDTKAQQAAEFDCVFCGEHVANKAWLGRESHQRNALKTCFGCGFWIDLLTKPHENAIVTLDYVHYVASDWQVKPRSGLGVGFSGRPFVVIFLDGTRRWTNNLWHQGEIPSHFHKYFPPNARTLMSVEHQYVPLEFKE